MCILSKNTENCHTIKDVQEKLQCSRKIAVMEYRGHLLSFLLWGLGTADSSNATATGYSKGNYVLFYNRKDMTNI